MMSFGDTDPLAAESPEKTVCKWGPHHTAFTCKRGLELTDEDIWGNRWEDLWLSWQVSELFWTDWRKQGG